MISSSARLKQYPTDKWSVRERLSLGCSVMRSGDQNWVSVSRAIKPYGEPNRPSDWFSQKNCALQYSELLEKVETPKRKRGEREVTETPGDVIVRNLTIERIEELKRIVQEEQKKYKKLKTEVKEIEYGEADERLQDIIAEMEEEKREKEEKERKEAEEIAARRTPQKKKPVTIVKTEVDDSTQDSVLSDANNTEDESTVSAAPSASTTPLPVVEEVRLPVSAVEQVTPPAPPTVQEPEVTQKIEEPVVSEPVVEPPIEIIPKVEIKEEPVEVEVPDISVEAEQKVDVETPEDKEDRTTRSSSRQETVKSGVPTLTRLLGNPPASVALSSPAPPSQSALSKSKGSANVSPASKSAAGSSKSPMAKSKTTPSPAAKAKPTEDLQPPPEKHVVTRSSAASEPIEVEKKETKVRDRTPSRDRKKEAVKEEDEQSVQDEGTDTENVSKTSTIDVEEPPSPASSVLSTETDSGSTRGKGGRRSRGGRGARRSTRVTRSKLTAGEEKKEEDVSSKQSEQETSDDEAHMESDDTSSVLTNSRGHGRSIIESQPNSPAGSLTHGSDTEDEKAHKIWKKSIMLVWRAAANHKYANVFSHPVTDEIAPGYSSVVFRPMDLLTIKKNIEAGNMRTTAEFQRDMMLMFTNAIMYNNSDHDVYNMATEMYDDVMLHIEQFVSTQMMVQAEPKILRASRRSEVLSDKEDPVTETKRKRNTGSSETPDHHGGKSKKRK